MNTSIYANPQPEDPLPPVKAPFTEVADAGMWSGHILRPGDARVESFLEMLVENDCVMLELWSGNKRNNDPRFLCEYLKLYFPVFGEVPADECARTMQTIHSYFFRTPTKATAGMWARNGLQYLILEYYWSPKIGTDAYEADR